MKEKCDNICNTCPVNSQIYCSLYLNKANNQNIDLLNKRIETIESVLIQVANRLEKADQEVPVLIPNTIISEKNVSE